MFSYDFKLLIYLCAYLARYVAIIYCIVLLHLIVEVLDEAFSSKLHISKYCFLALSAGKNISNRLINSTQNSLFSISDSS